MINTTAALRKLGKLIRQERETANLTQKELAKSIHMSQGTLVNIENGRNMSLATFLNLLDALDLKVRIVRKGDH